MVIWSEPAKADLRSIHNFITHNSPYYSRKVIQDIPEKMDILNDLPKVDKIVSEIGDKNIGDKNIRELSLYSYRMIYEIKDQNILVLAVIHRRRDLTA